MGKIAYQPQLQVQILNSTKATSGYSHACICLQKIAVTAGKTLEVPHVSAHSDNLIWFIKHCCWQVVL
jgi:hypothetical protein